MPRILALDIGDARVGLAMSDPSGGLAAPLKTVARAKGAAEDEILRLVREHQIPRLVVGLPLSENDREGRQAEKVRNFCRRIVRRVQVELVFVDEYLSTAEAEQLQSGNRLNGSWGVDAVAAAVILERYLAVGGSKWVVEE